MPKVFILISVKSKVEEDNHIISVLQQSCKALEQNNASSLKDLSNQTIHCASCIQDSASIVIAVLNYALSKIIERRQNTTIKNWKEFVSKFCSYYKDAADSLLENNDTAYQADVMRARSELEGISNIKPYIQEVIRNAAINKASKLYEHGISLGQTATLLGVTQWELSEYAGRRVETTPQMNKTISAKKRIETAVEFFG